MAKVNQKRNTKALFLDIFLKNNILIDVICNYLKISM